MKNKMRYVSWRRQKFRLPLQYFFGRRNVKDRLFCYIFERDRKALLQLYNFLNQTDYQDERALQIVTLDNVVYMSMNNDIAFLITGTLNLYEHQSTICPNLPLRFLLYIAAEYEGLVAKKGANIYGHTLVSLPSPQCVVFYNGNEETADEQYLQLSDAFEEKQNGRNPCLDLKVRMLNINQGHNRQLMADCRRLSEYSLFVDCIKKYHQDGLSTDESIDNAVMFCIDHGIMEDILLPFRAEVKKMLLTEYNERKYMRMFRKEAQAEGRAEGLEEGRAAGLEEGRELGIELGRMEERNYLLKTMLQNGASPEELSNLTGLSLNVIREAGQNKKKLPS